MIFTNFRYSVVYSFPHLFLKTNLKTANFNMSKNNVFTYFLIETNVRVLLSPLDIGAESLDFKRFLALFCWLFVNSWGGIC